MRLRRISSLLTESRRLGLNHCDFVQEISIRLEAYTNTRVFMEVIRTIISLGLPNLYLIELFVIAPISLRQGIDIFNYLEPLDQSITHIEFNTDYIDLEPSQEKEILFYILNRFKNTLRSIYAYDVAFNEDTQRIILQCSHIECIQLWHVSFPTTSIGAMLICLATKLANLNEIECNPLSHDLISGMQLCKFVNQCPGIKSINLELDESFNDKCLRYLAKNAPNLVSLTLSSKDFRNEEVWIEGDVRWYKLENLHLKVKGIALSFWEQAFHSCTKLRKVSFLDESPAIINKIEEYGFHYKGSW